MTHKPFFEEDSLKSEQSEKSTKAEQTNSTVQVGNIVQYLHYGGSNMSYAFVLYKLITRKMM